MAGTILGQMNKGSGAAAGGPVGAWKQGRLGRLWQAWEPWGLVLLLTLSTALLLRGWLLHPLPSAPRQETFAELNITAGFFDDLQHGRLLEAWNPREFCGYPWLRFIAYPVYWGLAAIAFLGGLALTDVMKGFLFLLYLTSGLTMYIYVRRLVPGRVAATVAAVAYEWLPAHAHLGVEAWGHAAIWPLLPLTLYVLERGLGAPRGVRRYVWALALGVLLGSYAAINIEYTVFSAPFIAIYLMAREAMAWRAGRETVRGSLGRLAGVVVVAIGLSAALVWPAVASTATVGIQDKHAGASTFTDILLRDYAITPSLVLYAIARRTHLPIPYGPLPGFYGAFWSVAWYPGLVAGGLLTLGLAAAWRERRLGLQVALGAMGVVMALGPTLPGNPFTVLPVLGRLTPYRAVLFVAAFGMPLVGLGARALLQWMPGLGLRGAALGVLLAALLIDFAPAAAAFTGVEHYFTPAEEAAQAWLWEHRGDGSYRLWEPRVQASDRYRGLLDITRIGIPRFGGYYDNGAPLHMWELLRWGDLATNLRLSCTRYIWADEGTLADEGVARALSQGGFQAVDWGLPGLYLYEDPHVLPYARAYPAAALCVGAQPAGALGLLPLLIARGVALVSGESPYLDDYDPATASHYAYFLVDGAQERRPGGRAQWLAPCADRVRPVESVGQWPAAPVVAGERVRWQRLSPGAVQVEVDLDAPAVVTIAEAWYPDWQVTVDGRPAPLLRVNWAFQGVWVEAGKHQAVFHYQAPLFDRVAAGVSLSTAVVVVAAALVLWWRGRGLASRRL